MPTRTQVFKVLPWDGGVNTSVDSGLIPNPDLVQAENIIFDTNGARIKRQGFAYFDALSAIPATTHRSSSGTTRTLVFASTIKDTGGTPNHKLVVGESITISNSNSSVNTNYGGTFVITGISTTNTTNDTITYTGSGSLAEGSTADTAFTITRADKIADLKDFFYFNTSTNAKTQQLVSATLSSTGDMILYRYDSSGRRIEISPRAPGTDTFVDGDVSTGSDTITLTTHAYKNYDRVRLTNSGGALPSTPAGVLSSSTDYYVIYVDANTIKLAASQRDVASGTAIDISSAAGGGTHTITAQTEDDFSAATSTRVTLTPMNEKLLITFDAVGVKPRLYYPMDDAYRLMTDIPDGFAVSQYAGRFWLNDKTNRDFIHWSSPQNQYEWLGYGDSGGMYVGASDGDPEGITMIAPPFKGTLIVTKRRKVYKINGQFPEDFFAQEMTGGLGSISPQAVASVDFNDLYFVSERGIHSVAATDAYGDFDGAFLSAKIQPTFNEWKRTNFKFMRAAYNPAINSVAFAVTEEGESDNSALWLYNVENKAWYTWPNVDAQALCLREESDGVPKLYYGTSAGRVVKTQSGELSDFSGTAIVYRIKSGTIYPVGDAQSIVGFKKVTLWYRPKGSFTFSVKIKIDNFATQSLSFSQAATGAELGVDFTLGESVLAFSNEFAPFSKPIDGYGRGFTIQVEQTGTEEEVEIWGFGVEFEYAEREQETKQSGVTS